MKKNILIIFLLLVIAILGCIILVSSFKDNNIQYNYSQNIKAYGDDFSDIVMYDENDNPSNISDIDADYRIAFFLHRDCSSCINMLPQIERLAEVYKAADLKVLLLWENEIPSDNISANNILNYSLHNVQIDDVYGTCFVIDKANKVEFRDESGLNSLVLKLSDDIDCDKEEIIESTNNYIRNHYGTGNSEKPMLIYFSMIGCPDCEEADTVIYTDDIQDKYEIIKISIDKNDLKVDKDGYMDDMRLYKNIYSITWYPSFLLLSEDKYEFIGEVSMDELIRRLSDF